MNVIVCGGYGRIGSAVVNLLLEDTKISSVCIVEREKKALFPQAKFSNSLEEIINDYDLVVDFTKASISLNYMKICVLNNKSVISGTTGYSQDAILEIKKLSQKGRIFYAPNFSYGINCLSNLVKQMTMLSESDYDIEIVEMHHNQKQDAPSGTALKLLSDIKTINTDYEAIFGRKGNIGKRTKKEIAVHSLRGGSVIGDHKVIFAGNGEVIELTHKASSRDTFAYGVRKAIYFMKNCSTYGLYGMENLFE